MSSLRDLVPQFDADGNPIDANGNPADPFGPQIDAMNQPDDSETTPDPNAEEPPPPSPPVPPTPEAPQTVEPPDQSGRNDILRQIAELNAKKSPWLEQNKGIYQQVSGLQSLLGEEDRRTNNEYERKLQEQTMYGKNMTNQQRIEMQQQASMNSLLGRQYGADQGLAGRQYAADATSGARAYSSDNTLAGRQYAADQGLTGRLGAATIGADAHVQGAQIGAGAKNYATDANVTIAGMPARRSASSGADNSAVPKLPASTQKMVNDIVTATDTDDYQKAAKLNQVLSPLGLAWSQRDKTIVRKPSFGGGAKGTVPSTTSAPSGPDATISAPTTGNTTGGLHGQVTPPDDSGGPNEGDIQQKGNARRVFQGGQWVPYSG